jgi:hypothetical protein
MSTETMWTVAGIWLVGLFLVVAYLHDLFQLPNEARVCEEHDESYPCAACRADAADRALDARKDDRDDNH